MLIRSLAPLVLTSVILAACARIVVPLDADAGPGRPDVREAAVDVRDVPATCMPGELSCGGRCVNPLVDPRNCGGCGRTCAPGQSCIMGTCPTVCAGTLMLCNGRCVDTARDPSNCGVCGLICSDGQGCMGGMCTPGCPLGLVPCGATCIDPLNDPQNCGGCGRSCGPGVRCTSGTCDTSIPTPSFQIASLATTGCVAIEHAAITGDDRGGIAVSPTSVFYTGDMRTGAFSAADLSGPRSLGGQHDGMAQNLRDGTIYVLSSAAGEITFAGGAVTDLREIDGDSGVLTGRSVHLSSTVMLTGGGLSSNIGIFSGYDRVVLYDGTRVFDISLPSGGVTDLGPVSIPVHARCESWAFWGTAETIRGELWLDYVQDSRTIVRTHVPDGASTTLAAFANLSDMCSFTVSPSRGRWYFHHEATSQFRTGDETIGFCDATFSAPTSVTRYEFSASTQPFVNVCAMAGATRVLAGVDDSVAPAFALPFAFPFYGVPFGAVRPSSNGYVVFGSTPDMFDNAYYPSAPLPDRNRPRNAAFAFNSDLYQRTMQGVCIATVGVAPNRQTILQTQDAAMCCGDTNAAHYTFEIVLNERDGTLDYVYQNLVHQPGDTRNFVIGTQNGDASFGSTFIFSMGGPGTGIVAPTALHLAPR